MSVSGPKLGRTLLTVPKVREILEIFFEIFDKNSKILKLFEIFDENLDIF